MSVEYRLVYSGEVLDGQHPAVVRKKLAAVLKLDDDRMDVLFSGKPVVVKKATDENSAARYQAAFQKAGARLRVLPVEDADDSAGDAQVSAAGPKQTRPASDGLELMPPGSAVLNEDERTAVPAVEVETDHLQVQGAVFVIDEPDEIVDAPNVDHLTLAELGAQLGLSQDQEFLVQEIDVDFDLAEVGAILGALDQTQQEPAVDAPDFELAEPGATMDTQSKPPPPAAPDTSHLKIDEDKDEAT